MWRCGDGLFFEERPLASDELFTTLHPLLENVSGRNGSYISRYVAISYMISRSL
jgi:hypothetical protein